MKQSLLAASLEAAVPLWIERVRDYPEHVRLERASEAASIIASEGDSLLYRTKRTADVFNALAEGLACAAFQPGGVTFLGRTFVAAWRELEREELRRAEGEAA